MFAEESFLSQVDRVRAEIRAKFSRSHQVLLEREAALLSELDLLASEYNGKGVLEQIQQLSISREQLMATLKGNENYGTLQRSVAPLDARIRELERSMNKLRRVELEWDGELEGILREMGGIRIGEHLDYKEKGEPLIVTCKHTPNKSTAVGMFWYPNSIATESQSQNVYICDGGNNRVQVFTKSGKFLFQFNEIMSLPFGLCISHDKVYVTQLKLNCLNVYTTEGNLLQSVGSKGPQELEFDQPMSVAVSTAKNLIFICDKNNDRIQCLNSDLTFQSLIPNIFSPRDIQLTEKEILVLKRGYYCICVFNYSLQFIREMIRYGEGTPLNTPSFFCLDQQNNVLMTDYSSHSVLIFSSRGELIHKFGRKGERVGEFIYPSGIALDSEDRIIVASENPNHCIQFF